MLQDLLFSKGVHEEQVVEAHSSFQNLCFQNLSFQKLSFQNLSLRSDDRTTSASAVRAPGAAVRAPGAAATDAVPATAA